MVDGVSRKKTKKPFLQLSSKIGKNLEEERKADKSSSTVDVSVNQENFVFSILPRCL